MRIKISQSRNEINDSMNWHGLKVNITILNVFKKVSGRLRIVSSKTEDIKQT